MSAEECSVVFRQSCVMLSLSAQVLRTAQTLVCQADGHAGPHIIAHGSCMEGPSADAPACKSSAVTASWGCWRT